MTVPKFRWEVPDTSLSTSTGYIHGNTKIHLFNIETGESVCKKYWQRPLFYDEMEYLENDECFCKRCLRKYKKTRRGDSK